MPTHPYSIEHIDSVSALASAEVKSLLLMGDESEEMIGRYIWRGHTHITKHDGNVIAVCVVTEEPDNWIEIKNLAVAPGMRRQGIGRGMLRHIESLYPGKKYGLGTGETPSTLRFYESCGYRYSHRVADFFTYNYDHPIIEEGIQLKDMLYLTKTDLTSDDTARSKINDVMKKGIKKFYLE